VNYEDPPSARVVIRGVLGGGTLLAGVALLALLVGSGRIEWKLVTLVLTLWGAYRFFDALLERLVEPFGRFLAGQLFGADLPGAAPLTIDRETAALERLVTEQTPPSAHRAILAGVRLAEIYRTRQHDPAKADALIARLEAQYPDAPELQYVRPPASG